MDTSGRSTVKILLSISDSHRSYYKGGCQYPFEMNHSLTYHTEGTISSNEVKAQKQKYQELGQLKVSIVRKVGGPLKRSEGQGTSDVSTTGIHAKTVLEKAISVGAQ